MSIRNVRPFRVATIMSLMLPAALALAQDPVPESPVQLEVYTAPQLQKFNPEAYPGAALDNLREGWVVVNLMVDPNGKPYEVGVVDSLGGAPFEKAAVRSIERSTFEPARVGGKAVDAGFMVKLRFALKDLEKGATSDYVFRHRKFLKATEAGDKAAADEALERLKPGNFYESAYFNLAMFRYHLKWGTPAQQMEDLRGAIAGEDKPNYLPKDEFTAVVSSLLRFEIESNRLGSALETWEKLKPLASEQQRAQWTPIIAELQRVKTLDSPIRHSDELGKTGSWFEPLFRRRFHVDVESGRISDIKLRCEKSYLLFRFDPAIEYSVKGGDGKCTMELVGEPGTRFSLIQT